MVGSELEQSDVAEPGAEVEVDGIAVAGDCLRPQVVLSLEPGIQVVTQGQRMHGHVTGEELRSFPKCNSRSGLGGKAALADLLSFPVAAPAEIDDVRPSAAAAVRQVRAVRCSWANSEVTLVDRTVLHLETPTSSSKGAVGIRMSLPRCSTGVGQRSVRISS